MTQDEIIIAMAREAGYQSVYLSDAPIGRSYQFLERFAALVAAYEREACAKVCEGRADSYKYATDPWAHEHISEANTCAAAIRARGEK